MYNAVSSSGTKKFLTPFAAARYLDKQDVTGTVEDAVIPGRHVTIWERLADGSWLIKD